MAQSSPLALYIDRRLRERDEPVYDFTRRVGINTSGFYKLLRGDHATPSQHTLEKIAGGLGMTAAELLRAVDGDNSIDPIEQAIRERAAEMREVVQGAPRAFWAAIIKATFDRAIESARDMAQLVAVSAPEKLAVSAPNGTLAQGKHASDDQLGVC